MLGMRKGGDVLRAPVPYGPRGACGGTLAVERGMQCASPTMPALPSTTVIDSARPADSNWPAANHLKNHHHPQPQLETPEIPQRPGPAAWSCRPRTGGWPAMQPASSAAPATPGRQTSPAPPLQTGARREKSPGRWRMGRYRPDSAGATVLPPARSAMPTRLVSAGLREVVPLPGSVPDTCSDPAHA